MDLAEAIRETILLHIFISTSTSLKVFDIFSHSR